MRIRGCAPPPFGAAHETASFGAEEIEFVAVEITEIAGVESFAARTGRTLVGAAELQGFAMQGVDLGAIPGDERDHDAVTDARGFLVVRPREAQAGPSRIDGPCDESVAFHRALRAEFAEQRIVEGRCARQIIGSDRDVSDHSSSPSMKILSKVKLKSISTRGVMAAMPVCALTSPITASVKLIRRSICSKPCRSTLTVSMMIALKTSSSRAACSSHEEVGPNSCVMISGYSVRTPLSLLGLDSNGTSGCNSKISSSTQGLPRPLAPGASILGATVMTPRFFPSKHT